MENNFAERLRSKSVQNSIINNISRDFNLTPILAEAYFNQIKDYFLQHADLKLTSGQVHYLAIDDREPAGKPVSLCKKVSVHLTLHNAEEDLSIYKQKGLSGLRQMRLLRITKEAIEQGALLSYEDIAFLLTTSVITIKRDIAYLRRSGLTIPSRGWRHDMGRGTTHKSQILELYISGYQFSEIERRTHHSETAVKRYIQDFTKIILLHMKGFSVDQIRISSGFSHRLIGEYIKLYDKYNSQANQRLKDIFSLTKEKTCKKNSSSSKKKMTKE
jgi:biotin operon repressor